MIDRHVLGGPDLEERFNAPWGNVYHVDPLPSRFGPLKPAVGLGGYKTPVEGLYLSGASTHPTGGVCALPGKLAAQALIRDHISLSSRLRRRIIQPGRFRRRPRSLREVALELPAPPISSHPRLTNLEPKDLVHD